LARVQGERGRCSDLRTRAGRGLAGRSARRGRGLGGQAGVAAVERSGLERLRVVLELGDRAGALGDVAAVRRAEVLDRHVAGDAAGARAIPDQPVDDELGLGGDRLLQCSSDLAVGQSVSGERQAGDKAAESDDELHGRALRQGMVMVKRLDHINFWRQARTRGYRRRIPTPAQERT